jgi:hypothetical protein
METNRNRNGNSDPSTHTGGGQQNRRQPGAPDGFEGMNFEEQRTSYKNSDGAGARDSEKGNRNGATDRKDG